MVQTKDIILRQMQPTDLNVLMQIKNDEHWNQTEADWTFLIKHYPKYCLVAEVNKQVVGTVTSTNYNNQVGWIGMMLVRKPFRGLGISRQLMSSVIDRLGGNCESIKLDATPAGEKVYNKLGFEKEYKVYRITNVDEDSQSIKPKTDLVREINSKILDSLRTKDLQVFGSDRSALIDFLLAQNTNAHGYITTGNDVKGYALSRFGTNFTQIGPVISESIEIAKGLIEWAFTKVSGPIVIDIPEDKTELIKWVESHGFKIRREFIRMYLRSNPFPGNTEKYFAIAGPEYG